VTTKPTKSRQTSPVNILIPVGDIVSKRLINQALHILSAFKNALIVLFRVVEVPSRTAVLEPEPYQDEIRGAEQRLTELAKWLTDQGLRVRVKVAVARSTSEGIVEEAQRGDYLLVFLMKRRMVKGWRRILRRSVTERVVRSANCVVMTAPLEELSRHGASSSKH
jgi:nucleotide-binding universal stress UspA family protein